MAALRGTFSEAVVPVARRQFDDRIAADRDQPDPARFAALWSEDQQLALDDAIALASSSTS